MQINETTKAKRKTRASLHAQQIKKPHVDKNFKFTIYQQIIIRTLYQHTADCAYLFLE